MGYTYTGDIEGTSTVTYLISYMAGGSAPVVGFEHFEGSIAGHAGTCVFQHVGTQDAGTVSLRLDVVAGLGTGGLEGLHGQGDVNIAGHSDNGYPLTLGFDVD